MTIYLDDDSLESLLIRLLRQAGHNVVTSVSVGLGGKPDPVHFRYAVRERKRLLTRNDRDFRLLHELILEAGGHHSGVLVVRFDNDRAKDLSARGVVLAIKKLEASGQPLENDIIVLNHWR